MRLKKPQASDAPYYGWIAPEAIAGAAYIFARHSDDLPTALAEGANTPGDSDSLACIAGALVGSLTGAGQLSQEKWLKYLEGEATPIKDKNGDNIATFTELTKETVNVLSGHAPSTLPAKVPWYKNRLYLGTALAAITTGAYLTYGYVKDWLTKKHKK